MSEVTMVRMRRFGSAYRQWNGRQVWSCDRMYCMRLRRSSPLEGKIPRALRGLGGGDQLRRVRPGGREDPENAPDSQGHDDVDEESQERDEQQRAGEFAAEHGAAPEDALAVGMEEKAREFREAGGEIYVTETAQS